jgi:ribose transport system permease protein
MVGITALGMTLVIISGGIDLSVGSVVALVTVAVAWLLDHGSLTANSGGGRRAFWLAAQLAALLNGTLITTTQTGPFHYYTGHTC